MRFKDLEIGDFFNYMGAKYRKAIQTQDILGTYNAISHTAPTGAKVLNIAKNTIVKKVNNGTPNT